MYATPHRKYKAAAALSGAAVLLCLVCATFPAQAAWTRPEGAVFTAQTLSSYSTRHFVNDAGIRQPQAEFRKYELNSYIEYGWREGTTLGGNFFLHRLSNDRRTYIPTSTSPVTLTEDNYGLADSEFFLRQRLWQGKFFGMDMNVALQPLIKLPSLYLDSGTPRSGSDNFDGELRLQTGFSFTYKRHRYFFANDIAYRKRMGELHDQWKADFTYGSYLTPRILALTQLQLTRRAEGEGQSFNSNAVLNDYDLWKAQLSLVYRLNKHTHIQLGAFKHIHARNTGDGNGVLFSIWREF